MAYPWKIRAPQNLPEPKQCVDIALFAKEAGNAQFKNKEYALAMLKYAKAVRYADNINWLGRCFWGYRETSIGWVGAVGFYRKP